MFLPSKIEGVIGCPCRVAIAPMCLSEGGTPDQERRLFPGTKTTPIDAPRRLTTLQV
jgi:hypothetical protein